MPKSSGKREATNVDDRVASFATRLCRGVPQSEHHKGPSFCRRAMRNSNSHPVRKRAHRSDGSHKRATALTASAVIQSVRRVKTMANTCKRDDTPLLCVQQWLCCCQLASSGRWRGSAVHQTIFSPRHVRFLCRTVSGGGDLCMRLAVALASFALLSAAPFRRR